MKTSELALNVRNFRGQSFIEFAVFIPILMICLFVSVEFGMAYTQAQKVTNLSREIAYAAYRDCADATTAPNNVLTNCLSAKLNDVQSTISNTMLPNFSQRGTLILSVYDSVGSKTVSNPANPPAAHATKFTAGDATLMSYDGRVIIGEVFYDYTAVTPVNNLLHLAKFPSVLYETAVY